MLHLPSRFNAQIDRGRFLEFYHVEIQHDDFCKSQVKLYQKVGAWSVWWRDGFLRIFKLDFLLFLSDTRGSNPAG